MRCSQRDVAAPRADAGMQLSTPSMHPPSKSAASRDLAGKGHRTTGHVELARQDAVIEETALIKDASGRAETGERGETRDVKARPYPFPETRGRKMEKESELKSSSNDGSE